jgi:hypothetical protein
MGIVLRRAPSELEIEELCSTAEEAVEQVIERRIGLKRIDDLRVTMKAEGKRPLKLTFDIHLTPNYPIPQLDSVLGEATDAAFVAVERRALDLRICKRTA